ncbi:hypothetical protein ARMSODRAFT_962089 [Armillaria solidipes]|uniref:Secreted protein n=1 Tax=Armillaria solidipes TaxID=1076256 RepID=A0A2H3BNC3_9AGAR|nr:hypothetical protein ARMSODRAFT_962089 [Armillaria solidipes]
MRLRLFPKLWLLLCLLYSVICLMSQDDTCKYGSYRPFIHLTRTPPPLPPNTHTNSWTWYCSLQWHFGLPSSLFSALGLNNPKTAP